MQDDLSQYFHNPTIKLRNQLVESNIGLARKVAHQFECYLDYDDALSLATIGLIKGIERYDPSKKASTGFLLRYCKGEVQHYLRDKKTLIRTPRNKKPLTRVAVSEDCLDTLVDIPAQTINLRRWQIIEKLGVDDIDHLISQLISLSV